MNVTLQVLTVFALPALITMVVWWILHKVTGSTKYPWAMAIAVGYAFGHVSFLAWNGVTTGEGEAIAGGFSAWSGGLGMAFANVAWPKSAVDWLPIGALLAGLVSVNAAAFGSSRIVAVCGAVIVTLFIVTQCLATAGLLETNSMSGAAAVKLCAGVLGVLGCWLSLGHSIVGRSRWAWIASVSILTVGLILVLGFAGQQTYATLAIVVLCAMLGSVPVCIRGSNTDNVRFAGAAIAASSVGLLMMAWWVSGMSWIPVALLVIGYCTVAFTPPVPIGTMMTRRLVTSISCSVAAVLVTVFVK